jgi:hypothetical protein
LLSFLTNLNAVLSIDTSNPLLYHCSTHYKQLSDLPYVYVYTLLTHYNQHNLSFIMQAEVENKPWGAYVYTGNEFRVRSSVTAQFANRRSVNLAVMWRAYSKTSAGDNAEAGFLTQASSEGVVYRYGLLSW